jgi:4-hydroxy-3-methylbut-2-enyl diphosphate reductase
VVAPLRVEAVAARGARIGYRARGPLPPGPLLLAGTAGAVVGLAPGDLVVADRVLLPGPDPAGSGCSGVSSDGRAHSDPLVVPLPDPAGLAERLRAAGLTVHVGPIGGADRIATGPDRRPWAARGALAVDLESGVLARTGRLAAVVRAVVDTPRHRLVSPGTVPRGLAALRALRRAAPVLAARDAAVIPLGEDL